MSRWVEKIRYSEGFASEEEAKKFLSEMEQDFKRFHEEMRRMTEHIFSSFFPKTLPAAPWTPTPEDLIKRIEKLETDLAEVKEQLIKKYMPSYKKVEIH